MVADHYNRKGATMAQALHPKELAEAVKLAGGQVILFGTRWYRGGVRVAQIREALSELGSPSRWALPDGITLAIERGTVELFGPGGQLLRRWEIAPAQHERCGAEVVRGHACVLRSGHVATHHMAASGAIKRKV